MKLFTSVVAVMITAASTMSLPWVGAESIRGAATPTNVQEDNVVVDTTTTLEGASRQLTTAVTNNLSIMKSGETNLFLLKHPATGKVLDLKSANCGGGTNLQVWSENWSKAQLWYFDISGRIVNVGCPGKAVDIKNNACSNGANAQLWDQNNSGAQNFQFANGALRKIHGTCTLGLSVDGSNVVLRNVNNDAAKWEVHYIRPFRLEFFGSSYRMDVKSASCDDNANLQLWTKNDSWAQVFYLDHKNRIVNFKCHKPIDVLNNACEDYTNIKLYSANDSGAQFWNIDPDHSSWQKITKADCTGYVLQAIKAKGGNVRLEKASRSVWTDTEWDIVYVDL